MPVMRGGGSREGRPMFFLGVIALSREATEMGAALFRMREE